MTTDQPQPGGSGAGSTAEDWARVFHDTYEQLAPDFGYQTRSDTRQFDPDSANGRLMIAVVGRVTAQLRADLAAAQAEIELCKEQIHAQSAGIAAQSDWLADARATIERQNAVITAARDFQTGYWEDVTAESFYRRRLFDALAALDHATMEAATSQNPSGSHVEAPSRVPAPNHDHTDTENADGPAKGLS